MFGNLLKKLLKNSKEGNEIEINQFHFLFSYVINDICKNRYRRVHQHQVHSNVIVLLFRLEKNRCFFVGDTAFLVLKRHTSI